MSTLLMRLAAPLQSWGVGAKFNRRGTERTPTKSGVIGLVASALGRKRTESVSDLQALRFGIRIDRAGTLIRDFHMAHEDAFWEKPKKERVHMTTRYYLADAVFVAALEGDEALLERIENALRQPVFPLFLGRRSCPPEGQVSLGIRIQRNLLEALREEPWQVCSWLRTKGGVQVHLHIAIEANQQQTNSYFQRDDPVSFDQSHRQYGFRRVSAPISVLISNPDGEHDPMRELN